MEFTNKDVSAFCREGAVMAWINKNHEKSKTQKRLCRGALSLLSLMIAAALLCPVAVIGAPEVQKMLIASEKLDVMGTPDLSGVAISSFACGENISVSKYSDGIYCVYSGGSVIGYCSANGLVGVDSVTYRYVPYKLGTDASGKVLVSDLVDLDYYIYETDSRLVNGADGVTLVQRATLEKLEIAAAEIGKKYTLRIVSAYAPSSSDPGLGVPANTGALITLSVRQGDIEWSLADLPQIASAMAAAGFSIVDGSDNIFCDDGYTAYLGVDYDLSNLPIFVLRG